MNAQMIIDSLDNKDVRREMNLKMFLDDVVKESKRQKQMNKNEVSKELRLQIKQYHYEEWVMEIL